MISLKDWCKPAKMRISGDEPSQFSLTLFSSHHRRPAWICRRFNLVWCELNLTKVEECQMKLKWFDWKVSWREPVWGESGFEIQIMLGGDRSFRMNCFIFIQNRLEGIIVGIIIESTAIWFGFLSHQTRQLRHVFLCMMKLQSCWLSCLKKQGHNKHHCIRYN